MQPTLPPLEDLIAYLQADDVQHRRQAAIALSQQRDERVVQPLFAALKDPDSTVRANAAAGLGTNKVQDAVQPLIALLRDEEDIVRERAATALAQIGAGEAIEPLLDALDDSGTWARNRIIYVLGASKDARAVEPLITLLDDDDATTQGVAAWALGAIGDMRAREPLRGLLRDEASSVRGNAAWALGELEDATVIADLMPLLDDDDAEVRGKTAWALGSLGEIAGDTQMQPKLIALLDDYGEVDNASAHIYVSQYAAEALMQLGTDEAIAAVEAWKPQAREKLLPRRILDLIRAMQHRDLQTREAIMGELQEIGAPAVEPLINALQNATHERVRQGAAQALGLLNDKRGVHTLITALADDDIGVWSQAVAALANLGDLAEKPLRPMLSSKKPRVKQGAAIAMWRIKREERAFKTLLQCLQDEDVVVRGSAITSLWKQPDERAVATLQIQLQNEDVGGMMARYILQALDTIGGPMATATVANYVAQHRDKLK